MGVLLVNLGTPDSQNPKDVKRYLKEFLTDGRVIDLPWLFRQLLVKGVIVPRRYRNSAKLYSAIWTKQGSPLKVYGKQVTLGLQELLGDSFQVELAMRYQSPSIERGLEALRSCRHLVIVPLFPQYASATTGSIYQEAFRVLQKWDVIPALSCIDHFETDPEVIEAFCDSASQHDFSKYDHFVFSYHGLPEKQIRKANSCSPCLKSADCCQTLTEKNQFCYSAQCVATTQAIVSRLGLSSGEISHCYQSRLGRDPWLKPYTSDVLENLAKQGKKKLLVFCPAFVADCLETLYEIRVEYQTDFKKWGGERLELVEGLNANKKWITALKNLVLSQVS